MMKLSKRILNKGQLVDANETETGLFGITEEEHYEIEQLEADRKGLWAQNFALRELEKTLTLENEALRNGISRIVAGIRMNTKREYILTMMDVLDAF